jgi:YfiR/HmsC-like
MWKNRSFYMAYLNRALSRVSLFSLMSLWLLVTAAPTQAQSQMRLHTLKIAYVYNFSKFIEWENHPSEKIGADTDHTFQLCLISEDSQLQNTFLKLTQKSTENAPLLASHLKAEDNNKHCQIIYISGTQENIHPLDLDTQTLTVTDQADTKALIHFKVINNKLRFDIDKTRAEAMGLRVSSKLLRLAHEVY